MENLDLYEKLRTVPDSAKKTIQAGKLKGFTDINPVWRIKALTEAFGPCGIGWRPEIVRQWLESYEGVICAFCNINLYIKVDGAWSEPIPGTGGSRFVSQTRNGTDVSDECFKMAYTDAISVAAKMIGVAADVYWTDDSKKEDKTKYADEEQRAGTDTLIENDCKKFANYLIRIYGRDEAQNNLLRLTGHHSTSDVTYDEYWFAMKKIDRELRLENEKSDFIGDVEISAVKEAIAQKYGEFTSEKLFELTGKKESDLPNLTHTEWGMLARKLNEALKNDA